MGIKFNEVDGYIRELSKYEFKEALPTLPQLIVVFGIGLFLYILGSVLVTFIQ